MVHRLMRICKNDVQGSKEKNGMISFKEWKNRINKERKKIKTDKKYSFVYFCKEAWPQAKLENPGMDRQ